MQRILDIADFAHRSKAAETTAEGRRAVLRLWKLLRARRAPGPRLAAAMNVLKGRPLDQVGSVTTTPERAQLVFDWDKVQLPWSSLVAVMAELHALGPIGFRGPAADPIPEHLTVLDAGVRTGQLIFCAGGRLSGPSGPRSRGSSFRFIPTGAHDEVSRLVVQWFHDGLLRGADRPQRSPAPKLSSLRRASVSTGVRETPAWDEKRTSRSRVDPRPLRTTRAVAVASAAYRNARNGAATTLIAGVPRSSKSGTLASARLRGCYSSSDKCDAAGPALSCREGGESAVRTLRVPGFRRRTGERGSR